MSGIAWVLNVKDAANPALAAALARVTPERLAPVAGRAVATLWRKQFVALNGVRHKDGGNNFYGQAARATNYRVVGALAFVSCNQQGLRLRYEGGDIVAGAGGTGKKWLTISARQETYGRAAGEFNDLKFVPLGKSGELAALVQRDQSSLGGRARGSVTPKGRVKGTTIGGGVFYWLRKKVHQDPDPSVLPTREETMAAAQLAIGNYLAAASEGKN